MALQQHTIHFLFFIVLALYPCLLASSRKLQEGAPSMSERHEQWITTYGRIYRDEADKAERLEIFRGNVEFIESFNAAAGDKPYKLGLNQFADMTGDEVKSSRNGYKRLGGPAMETPFWYENVSYVPSTMDWRKEGAVTPIKNQHKCVVGHFQLWRATEGITSLSTGKLVSLSEQELVDCDRKDDGCEGGLLVDAVKFIIHNKGLSTESKYPYEGTNNGTCDTRKEHHPCSVAKITGYERVPNNSEAQLLKAVANQPVSVAIDASGLEFYYYLSGIFTGSCGTRLDHGVTAVGYGESNGTKYWLVKNSWGTSWGEEGYIKMERDVDAKEGLCGIAMDSSYPTA